MRESDLIKVMTLWVTLSNGYAMASPDTPAIPALYFPQTHPEKERGPEWWLQLNVSQLNMQISRVIRQVSAERESSFRSLHVQKVKSINAIRIKNRAYIEETGVAVFQNDAQANKASFGSRFESIRSHRIQDINRISDKNVSKGKNYSISFADKQFGTELISYYLRLCEKKWQFSILARPITRVAERTQRLSFTDKAKRMEHDKIMFEHIFAAHKKILMSEINGIEEKIFVLTGFAPENISECYCMSGVKY